MTVDRRTTKLLFFLGAGGLAGSFGLVFDILLMRGGMPRFGVLVLSNLVTGAVAGTLFVQTRLRRIERQQVIKDRLSKIADMNHHVRNALAVVAYYGTRYGNDISAQLVSQAVERIEWTLREVLPRGWGVRKPTSTWLVRKGSRCLVSPVPGLVASEEAHKLDFHLFD